ncbi:hypothetical protein D0N36_06200 [Hymenobacter lapidiphilus]|nr:hypothetical protein D0N36_06200 [Hymenobacter sp. CCM 8763]
MPLSWGQVRGERQLITPKNPFGLRTEVKATTGPEANIKVYLAYISQEISPSDWLTMSLHSQKEHVVHERHIAQPGGAVPDVLTIGGPAGARRISRWLVLKNWAEIGGAHFFVVQASTPEANYTPDMANVFFMAVSNFKLMHPTEWDYAEQLRTLVQTVPAKLSTVFPLSWHQQNSPLSDEHFYQVKLTKDLVGRRIGLVNLMLTAGQSEVEMRQLEDENRLGYQQADHLTFAPAQLVPAPKFGSFDEVFTALSPQTNVAADTPAQERQVLLARAGTFWVLMENIRFTQQDEPVAWAVSKRGFEIVQDNLVVKP